MTTPQADHPHRRRQLAMSCTIQALAKMEHYEPEQAMVFLMIAVMHLEYASDQPTLARLLARVTKLESA